MEIFKNQQTGMEARKEAFSRGMPCSYCCSGVGVNCCILLICFLVFQTLSRPSLLLLTVIYYLHSNTKKREPENCSGVSFSLIFRVLGNCSEEPVC